MCGCTCCKEHEHVDNIHTITRIRVNLYIFWASAKGGGDYVCMCFGCSQSHQNVCVVGTHVDTFVDIYLRSVVVGVNAEHIATAGIATMDLSAPLRCVYTYKWCGGDNNGGGSQSIMGQWKCSREKINTAPNNFMNETVDVAFVLFIHFVIHYGFQSIKSQQTQCVCSTGHIHS